MVTRPRVFVAIALAVAGILLTYAAPRPSSTFSDRSVAIGRVLPGFRLIDQENSTFSLEELRERPLILFFGYTNCPDICPLAMRKITESLRGLGKEGESFAIIFITVDPLRDTPERLRAWAETYYPRPIALTGGMEELKRVWVVYGAARPDSYEESGSGGGQYFISHSAVIYVADKYHVLRYILTPEMPVDDFRETLRNVLRY